GSSERYAKPIIVAIESDDDSVFAELFLEIIARLFALARAPNKIPIHIQLDVAVMIRTIETVHHEWNPRGAALQESNAKLWKTLDDAVDEHSGGLNAKT